MKALSCWSRTIAICCVRLPTGSTSFPTDACANSTAIWTITATGCSIRDWPKPGQTGRKPATEKPEKPVIDRKEQKRLEAQERQRISILKKPLEKRIAWLENEIGKLNGEKTAIDSQLADPAIYEPANKDRLKKLLADQIECTKQLNSREEEWLEKQDELEKILAS